MRQPHERAGSASLVLVPQRAAGEPYTTSEIIAEGTGINHRRVRDAIRKYQTDLETFGRVVAYQTPLETKGGVQAVPGYILNEQQATFLLTLLKNTPVVVAFKKELVRQFYAMRSLLLERASPIWQDARSLGKEIRRQETEAIKLLVDYAAAQGSRRAGWYYANLSKLADTTVGIARTKKFPDRTPYQMNLSEAFSLASMSAEDAIGAISLAFEYGRAKGYRAAKAEEKARTAAV